jgi:hypothetical protein
MTEKHTDDKKVNYQYDEDRMVNEGLAGGTVNPEYKKPAVDEARDLQKEEKPRDSKKEDTSDSEKKDTDFEIDKMVDEGMAGGQVNERYGKKQIKEEPPTDKSDKKN